MSIVHKIRPRSIGLETVYTDFVLCYHRWAGFIKRLQTDWTELVLFVSIPKPVRCNMSYTSPSIGYCVAERQCGVFGHTKC